MSKSIPFLLLFLLSACTMNKKNADLLIKNATIYTVDDSFSMAEALVIKDGRILELGGVEKLEKKYQSDEVINMNDHYIYPGWNDAHCHFVGYGLSLNQVDLTGTKSVNEILKRCKDFALKNQGSWITGRGWDQNDWEKKEFPSKEMLDEVFPDSPVLLRRIDGHAGWANTKALEIAGISATSSVEGGDIIVKNGEPSGILIDNAIDLVSIKIPDSEEDEIRKSILMAQENCFSVGLTSVSDAGLSTEVVQLISKMHEEGILKMRINAWLNPSESNFSTFIEKGVYQDERLTIGTLKLYADGALGSRGAKMLEDYSDDPGNNGLFVTESKKLKTYCQKALENNFQVAIHCIGDAANREVLKIYSELLEPNNDRRWRIEHSQIIHLDDFKFFGKYNIVPSIQSTHATSDMYWAEDRIGPDRIRGAYSYKSLLNENGWIPNGSDFPVEDINPLYGFYAAVSRKDKEGNPEGGFRIEEALSRKEALQAMTSWAAKAAFEEKSKGMLKAGMLADFVVTKKDIMTVAESELHEIKVYQTWSGGKLVYQE